MKHIRWFSLAMGALVVTTLACGGSRSTPTPSPPPTDIPPTPAPTVASTATLEIINDSVADIWYIYLSPSASDLWGDDHLGDNVIADGESFTLTGIPFDTYDVKAEDADNNVVEFWLDVEFDGPMTWTVVDSEGLDTASLTIVNSSGAEIWYIYLSPSFSDEWGDDHLGDNTRGRVLPCLFHPRHRG